MRQTFGAAGSPTTSNMSEPLSTSRVVLVALTNDSPSWEASGGVCMCVCVSDGYTRMDMLRCGSVVCMHVWVSVMGILVWIC